jgi:lipopolysaccharide export system permease protein
MLLARSVLWETARSFLAALIATTGAVFFMLAILFMKRTPGVGIGFLVEIFPLFFPLALQFTVPLSVLVGVVLTFSRMAGDGELTALAANGIRRSTLAWPVLAGAALIGLLAFVLTDLATPYAAERLVAARRDLVQQLQTSFRSGLRDLDLGRGRISFETFVGREFTDVCLEWRRSKDDVELWRAERGSVTVVDDRVVLALKNAQQTLPRPVERGTASVFVGDLVVEQPLGELLGAERHRRRGAMSARELAYVQARGLGKGPTTSAEAGEELARRTALAASAFFFALAGIPLGARTGRGGRVAALLFGIGPVLVVYFPVVILAGNLAKAGQAPAFPSLWSGNLLLGLAGAAMLRRQDRR